MAIGKAELQILINAKDNASGALGKIQGSLKLVGVAALAAGGASIKMAADFDKGMREVATLTPEVADNLDAMKKDVLDLSSALGVDAVEATGALYQAISAGVPTDNAISFLEIASKAAIGGVTDTETAVDGLTTVMNAFAGQNISAQEAADIMFTTVKAGKTDFAQLSGALFNVAPLANAAGVSFEEISAGMATITAQGTPTSVATTQLRAAIQGLTKPSDDLTAIFRAQGFESGELAVQQLGLAGAADIVRDATGGSISEMQALLGSMEGVSAILGITGDNAETFAKNVASMGDAAGASEKAFQIMEESTSRAFEKMTAKVKTLGIRIGEKALPIVNTFLDVINDIGPPAEIAAIAIAAVAASLGLVALVAGPVATGIGLMTTAITILNTRALAPLAKTIAAMSLVTVGWILVIGALVAAIAVVGHIFGWWKGLGDKLGEMWEEVEGKLANFTDGLFSTTDAVKDNGEAVGGLKEDYRDAEDAARGAADALVPLTEGFGDAEAGARNVADAVEPLDRNMAYLTATFEDQTVSIEAQAEAILASWTAMNLASGAVVISRERLHELTDTLLTVEERQLAMNNAVAAGTEILRDLNIESELRNELMDMLAEAVLPPLEERLHLLAVALANAGNEAAEVDAILKDVRESLIRVELATADYQRPLGMMTGALYEGADGTRHLSEGLDKVDDAAENGVVSIRRYSGGLSRAETASRRLASASDGVQGALEAIGLEAEVLEAAYVALADIGIKQAAEGFELLEERIREWGVASGQSVDTFIDKLGDLRDANEDVLRSEQDRADAARDAANASRDAADAAVDAAERATRATENAERIAHRAAVERAKEAGVDPPRDPVSRFQAETIAAQRKGRQVRLEVLSEANAQREYLRAIDQIEELTPDQRMQFAAGTLAGISFGQGFTGFQRGGSFMVPGSGGPDSQLVSFAATPGERVSVTRPGQGGAVQQTIIVQGSIVTERQLSALAVQAMRNATRLNQSVLNVNAVVA